jgi:hypothetical protein
VNGQACIVRGSERRPSRERARSDVGCDDRVVEGPRARHPLRRETHVPAEARGCRHRVEAEQNHILRRRLEPDPVPRRVGDDERGCGRVHELCDQSSVVGHQTRRHGVGGARGAVHGDSQAHSVALPGCRLRARRERAHGGYAVDVGRIAARSREDVAAVPVAADGEPAGLALNHGAAVHQRVVRRALGRSAEHQEGKNHKVRLHLPQNHRDVAFVATKCVSACKPSPPALCDSVLKLRSIKDTK